MTDSPLAECPRCGKHIRRVLSAGIGISFRGSGFYATDSGKAKPAAKKDEKPSAPDAPKKIPACPATCADCPAAKAG
jgi:predicted nucleic acid-binding Zn ribbon protein